MKWLKQLFLFLVFGFIYFIIETIYKGHLTHWTMFVLAGVIGTFVGGLNEYIPWEMPLFCQCGIGMIIATLLEGISGVILNIWLKLNIWHYNTLTFFWGQCSLIFCVAWFVLAGACILLDDWLRWKLFNEEKPHYIL